MTRLKTIGESPAARIAGVLLSAGVMLAATSAAASAATQNDQTQFSVSAGALSFYTAPAMPTLTSVTLTGAAQTTNTTMTNFAVQDGTGTGSGWNVTVNGNGNAGKSAVFAQYCPTGGGCGTVGYVTSGATLAADSLTLNSTGASAIAQSGTGTTGTAPGLSCNSGCFVDHGTAVKTVSAASGAGMGTWTTSGWSGTSLALATPTTLAALPSGEVYRVDLVWTLNSGP